MGRDWEGPPSQKRQDAQVSHQLYWETVVQVRSQEW